MVRPFFCAVSTLALVFVIPSRLAFADGSHDAAVASFEQARRSIEAGDCPSALPKLEESLKNEPSIGAHLSYADCFESIDPFVSHGHLREAALLAYLRHDERHAVAEKRANALLEKIAAIRVTARGSDLDDPGFVFRIDNKTIDRFHLGSPIGVRPGEHVATASTTDGRKWSQRITGDVGKLLAVEVILSAPAPSSEPKTTAAPTPPVSSTTPTTTTERGSTQRMLGIIVSAVGIGGIATGGAFGVVTIARRNDLDRACNGDIDQCTGNKRTVAPIMVSAENSATASTIFFAAGAAVLVSGIAIYLTAPRSSSASAPKTGLLRSGAMFQW